MHGHPKALKGWVAWADCPIAMQAAWEAVGARVPAEDRARTGPPNVGRNGRWQLNLYDGDGTRTELMEPFTVR